MAQLKSIDTARRHQLTVEVVAVDTEQGGRPRQLQKDETRPESVDRHLVEMVALRTLFTVARWAPPRFVKPVRDRQGLEEVAS